MKKQVFAEKIRSVRTSLLLSLAAGMVAGSGMALLAAFAGHDNGTVALNLFGWGAFIFLKMMLILLFLVRDYRRDDNSSSAG